MTKTIKTTKSTRPAKTTNGPPAKVVTTRSVDTVIPDRTEVLYQFLVESLTEYAVFAVSRAGLVISWNAGAQRIFGYDENEIVGVFFGIIFTLEDRESDAPAKELASALSGEQAGHDRWHVRKDGSRFWGTNTVQPLYDKAGVLLGFTKLVRDTTEGHIALEALSDSEERLRLLIESVREYAIFSTALDGSITSWNSGAEHTFGYQEHEILGSNFDRLFLPDDVLAGVPTHELREAALSGHADEERQLMRKDGSRFYSSAKLSQLKHVTGGELRGFVMVAHDISESRQSADEMRRRASTDHLTQLANRSAFYEHLTRAIASMKRRSTNLFAVLFIDLDRFKEVNDTFGHIVADRLLESTARRLESCARSEDVIARIGGDEFAILLNGINGIGDAIDAAERIGLEMSKQVSVDEHTIDVTASVGIALAHLKYEKPEDILRDADAAMYTAKMRGRARAVIYDPTMDPQQVGSLDLEADLRHAVERNELRVEYQPVLRLSGRSIAGFEVLARWQHPRRGLLQPADFIPKAEESDLIISIDRWVLAQACAQLAVWQSQYEPQIPLTISVNFSSKQFASTDLFDHLRQTFARTGIDPRCVHLEITETAILEHSERMWVCMAQVRELGIQLHVDDFGTGYSTLASLQHIPVDALKIDRSFVKGMESRRGAELVRTIVTLAHNLGLVAIGEGVETSEQLNHLARLGCEYGQGFLFSKPLSQADAQAFLIKAGHVRAS